MTQIDRTSVFRIAAFDSKYFEIAPLGGGLEN